MWLENLIYTGPTGPRRSKRDELPSLSLSSFFFLSSGRGTDVTIFVADRPIARRTRAICPGNIPHGMPSVCPAFVSASFRFLRQHGGLSLIYPRSPNTRYFLTDVSPSSILCTTPCERNWRRDSRIGARKRFDDVWWNVGEVVCEILTNLWFNSIFWKVFWREKLEGIGEMRRGLITFDQTRSKVSR